MFRKATATKKGVTTTATATQELPQWAAHDAVSTAQVVAAAAAYKPVSQNAAARQSSKYDTRVMNPT